MRAVGFAVPRVLGPGQAAKWSNHVLERVGAAEGHYRRINQSAKRDWHRLLEYNRLDCEGLRAVHTRAVRELDLWRTYEKTSYLVPAAGIDIRVGWNPRRLRQLLERARAREWAFITACNPGSVPLPRADNVRRNLALLAELRRHGPVLDGIGVGEDATWEPEPSFLALGISRSRAVALARKYGQLAIVCGTREEGATLVPCEPAMR
jgi:hypothetical protein